jgi:hypothetical protein
MNAGPSNKTEESITVDRMAYAMLKHNIARDDFRGQVMRWFHEGIGSKKIGDLWERALHRYDELLRTKSLFI